MWRPSLTLLLLLCAASAMAGEPRDEPIELDADHWEADGREGYSIYSGNVELRQGGVVLRGDRMLVRAPDEVFEYAEITGEPANFEQQEPGRPLTRGWAERIEYFASDERLVLEGSVRIEQPNQALSAGTATYSMREERITAAGGVKDGEGRVRMRMQPRRDGDGNGG
jgi:lipopolysaccharide export system protein LptA